MVKFLFVGRRAAGRTRADALAHLRDVHGRMVVCAPADAGAMPADYTQNHAIDGAYPAGAGPHAIDRDLITELVFDSMAAMKESVETPYYLANLRPDEPRFVDDATVAKLSVAPTSIVEGRRTSFKLFAFASRATDADDAGWQATRASLTQAIADCPGMTMLVENEVLPSLLGPRFVDTVLEAWFVDRDAALSAVPVVTASFAQAGVAQDRSLVIVAEEFTRDRLRALLRDKPCRARAVAASGLRPV